MSAASDDLRSYRSPFDDLLGSAVVAAGPDEVVVELPVRAEHHQPYGIVHGGVYATLVETAASIAANAYLLDRGIEAAAVGVSNATDFLRPTASGTLRATATPLQRGRRLQLWEVRVTDADGRLAAHGKVKLFNRAADG